MTDPLNEFEERAWDIVLRWIGDESLPPIILKDMIVDGFQLTAKEATMRERERLCKEFCPHYVHRHNEGSIYKMQYKECCQTVEAIRQTEKEST